MGASVMAYWPGISEEQIESQPGFFNDCNAWGDWMAEREREPNVLNAVKRLKAGAILTHTTEGLSDEQVLWVTPKELREAAARLREAIQEQRHDTEIILGSYERNANGIDPIPEEFIRDLDDIEGIATWAEEEGARCMTLQVSW
jgi:hypothetical protein